MELGVGTEGFSPASAKTVKFCRAGDWVSVYMRLISVGNALQLIFVL